MASLPNAGKCTTSKCTNPPIFYCPGCKGWACRDHGRFIPLTELRLTAETRKRVPAQGVMFACGICQAGWMRNGRPTVINF